MLRGIRAAGLRDVMLERQTVLLEAAIKAGIPRFIPSDYSIDFTKFPPGENRGPLWMSAAKFLMMMDPQDIGNRR